MKIKDLSKVDMPREKLQKYGTDKLADHELLAIVLGSGIEGTNVLELSKKILKLINRVGKEKITFDELCAIKGLGKTKASQVIATLALGKRFTREAPEVLSAEDVWRLCVDIRGSKREHFLAFYFDTQHRLIERHIISIGTLNSSLVHPREVFEPAVTLHAASLILVHNHPSGDLEPSTEDREVTQRLMAAGELLGIQLLDHVIISAAGFLSFQQVNLL